MTRIRPKPVKTGHCWKLWDVGFSVQERVSDCSGIFLGWGGRGWMDVGDWDRVCGFVCWELRLIVDFVGETLKFVSCWVCIISDLVV